MITDQLTNIIYFSLMLEQVSKAEQQDGAAMLLVPSQNCCNRNCLG